MSEFNANPPQPRLPDPGQPQFTPPRGHVPPGTPAWQSIPSAVRFAVWVWAISVIASLAGAAILLVLFAIGINAAILGGN